MTDSRLERNLRLIVAHEGLTRALVWMPVFVLFTRARFDLDGAVTLASLYYLFVVVLEVPSGWMSDRVGRVPTLRLAALTWVAAHACFALGDDRFVVILAGQALMAAGFACLSGTDVTFHYDSLEALDRSGEYLDRQARVASIGYAVRAVGSIAGGALALVDLRAVFWLALALATVQFAVTLRFTEPPSTSVAEAIGPQVRSCLGYLRDRYVGWIFLYGIALVPLEHVAVTALQPWLTEVLDRTADDLGGTPLLSGALMAGVGVVGAASARASAPLRRRHGAVATLIGVSIVSSLLVTTMAATTHIAVVALVAFRSVQTAISPVVISAEVAPRVEARHRATLLSLDSLGGRLSYGLVLLVIAGGAGDDVTRVLTQLAVLAWVLVGLLLASAALLLRPRGTVA